MAIHTARSLEITREQALTAWRAGNDAGEGFATDEGSVDAAVASLRADGYGLVMGRRSDGEVAVLSGDGKVIAIGDAHGAWAVDITSRVAGA